MHPKLLKLLRRVFDVSKHPDSGKLLSEMSSWNSLRSWWKPLYDDAWFSDVWFSSIHTSIWQKNNPDTPLSQHKVRKEHQSIMLWAKSSGIQVSICIYSCGEWFRTKKSLCRSWSYWGRIQCHRMHLSMQREKKFRASLKIFDCGEFRHLMMLKQFVISVFSKAHTSNVLTCDDWKSFKSCPSSSDTADSALS